MRRLCASTTRGCCAWTKHRWAEARVGSDGLEIGIIPKLREWKRNQFSTKFGVTNLLTIKIYISLTSWALCWAFDRLVSRLGGVTAH